MAEAEEILFNLSLPGADGKKVPFQFTTSGLRDLVAQLLLVAAKVPLPPSLERQLTLDDNPVPVNGFMVTPLEGDPQGGHVSIGIGPIDLQFAVSLDVLFHALDALKRQSEPGSTSGPRPN